MSFLFEDQTADQTRILTPDYSQIINKKVQFTSPYFKWEMSIILARLNTNNLITIKKHKNNFKLSKINTVINSPSSLESLTKMDSSDI